jgi:hypothetical protein
MKTRSVPSRLLLFFLALLLYQSTGCTDGGTSQGTGTWAGTVQFGTPLADEVAGIATDDSGSVYVGGRSEGDIDNCGCLNPEDGFIVKYDQAGEMEWLLEVDADGASNIRTIAVGTGGYVYAGGWSDMDVAGTGNLGGNDIFLCKVGPGGNVEWIRQVGTSMDDYLLRVVSGPSGNTCLVGYTWGSFPGYSNDGGRDVFAIMIDPLGAVRWVVQFGTGGEDFAEGSAMDASGNVYVVGRTYGSTWDNSAGQSDVFVAKIDASGRIEWIRQLGTAACEGAYAAATDAAGNIYVVGKTLGDLGGGTNAGELDLFLLKMDRDGKVAWTRLIGTPRNESGEAVGVRGGFVYVAGSTSGTLDGTNEGERDAFLAKFDGDGILLWTRQFGTPGDDLGLGIAITTEGDVFCSGTTEGNMGDHPNEGVWDAFVAKFGPDGNRY